MIAVWNSGLGIIIAVLANEQYQTLLAHKFFFRNGQLLPYAAIPLLYALVPNITSQLNLEKKIYWMEGGFCVL
jgi:hypothetical protein